MSVPFVIATVLGWSAAAISTARMELPEDFAAQATRIEISGFGGRNKGHYTIADPYGATHTGEFRRGESRLGIFDPLYVKNRGKSSFDFSVAAGQRQVNAVCEFRKDTVTVDIVTVDTKKLAYQCRLGDDSSLADARIVIGQPRRDDLKTKLLATELRAGESWLFGEKLYMESVHAYAGTPLTSQTPVGYLIRSAGRTLAAVELTDVNPGLYLMHDLPETQRQAILVTALAIAVFRDPAVSALEED